MAYRGTRAAYSPGTRGRGTSRGAPNPRRFYPNNAAPARTEVIVPPTQGLGAEICEIEVADEEADDEDAAVENVVPIASYSWTDEKAPTMVVPSSPAVWRSRSTPFQCKVDSGLQFINQNTFRCPTSPLTPLVEAIRYFAPTFAFNTIDIVTDRNNLRKLILWAQVGEEAEDFRIDIQRAGLGTVLFTRWQEKTQEMSQRSYGKEFEKTMTRKEGANPGENHHRIVTDDFGELNLLVRFEVDACYPSSSKAADSDLDDLISQAGSLSLSSSTKPSTDKLVTRSGISIIPSRSQNLVAQKNLIELATRSYKSRPNFNWLVKYPQLYLSETPTFILGVHDRGMFNEIETFRTDDLSNAEVRQAREEIQPGLNKLAKVLGVIRDKVLELTDDDATGSRRERLLALVCEKGKLRLYERPDGPKLPSSLVACFD